MAQIRAWAVENGHEVADRGRPPQVVLDAYYAH
ncbi:Lsr2 family DNA-binding protein [Variovorax sp. PBS-H4]